MSLSFLSNTRGKYLTKKLLELINDKVDAEEGKGLSSNDFTAELKSKLDGIAEGATKTMVDTAVNSTSTNPVQNKAVYAELGKKAATASPTFTGTLKAPTATAGTNDTQIATTAFVTNAVRTAVSAITGVSFSVVTALPQTGKAGVIYLLANNSGKSQNIYDEYIWTGTDFEKMGSTEIDLSGYVKSEDLQEITEAEIESWFKES